MIPHTVVGREGTEVAGGVRPPLGARRYRVFRAVGGSYLARDYHLLVHAIGGSERETPVARSMRNRHTDA
ncbi:hypothetical protein GCM10007147_25240 [Nocardiopsis kunsanensis]|uniref:Uncharacterized protein n=1 Tax=Nocardiopsis kunsanensis TaxID=141693 RepID=A0A918XCS9_9ACTN|nr:hypothetical protein GCM10007147_25240 [Nocardiopsis kunsanensis]